MKREDIIALFTPTLPRVLYGWYAEGNEPVRPYAVLNFAYANSFYADNVNFLDVEHWQLDLITDKKQEEIEASIEDAFKGAEITYEKRESSSVGEYYRVYYLFTTTTYK